MTTNKQQYLITVWHQLLEYLHSNRNIATTVIDNFYVPCSLYDLSDEKAIIEAPNIISKEVIQADLEMLSASFTDLLQLTHPIIVEIYQKSELPTDLFFQRFQ
jgi:chromosomal replication initiator protein